MRKFKLIKDRPEDGVKAGAIFKEDEDGYFIYVEPEEGQWSKRVEYHIDMIKANPNFFEEIKELNQKIEQIKKKLWEQE